MLVSGRVIKSMIIDKSHGYQNVLIELLEFQSWTQEYAKKQKGRNLVVRGSSLETQVKFGCQLDINNRIAAYTHRVKRIPDSPFRMIEHPSNPSMNPLLCCPLCETTSLLGGFLPLKINNVREILNSILSIVVNKYM